MVSSHLSIFVLRERKNKERKFIYLLFIYVDCNLHISPKISENISQNLEPS